jgi:hypothetical protein
MSNELNDTALKISNGNEICVIYNAEINHPAAINVELKEQIVNNNCIHPASIMITNYLMCPSKKQSGGTNSLMTKLNYIYNKQTYGLLRDYNFI